MLARISGVIEAIDCARNFIASSGFSFSFFLTMSKPARISGGIGVGGSSVFSAMNSTFL
jgi:hypothetical protein